MKFSSVTQKLKILKNQRWAEAFALHRSSFAEMSLLLLFSAGIALILV